MITLYEMIEKLFCLLEQLDQCGAMLMEEQEELAELENIWYNYYEKNMREENE